MKKGIIACVVSVFTIVAFSQDYKKEYEVGIHGNLFIGGDFNAIYGLTTGIEGQYYIAHKNKFSHFINGGFTTALGTEGANLYLFDVGIGTQYKLITLFGNNLFAEASIGALYWQEQLATQLLNATVESTFNEFGFKAKLGIGYQITNHLTIKFNATQFDSSGTAVGVGFSYSF